MSANEIEAAFWAVVTVGILAATWIYARAAQ